MKGIGYKDRTYSADGKGETEPGASLEQAPEVGDRGDSEEDAEDSCRGG